MTFYILLIVILVLLMTRKTRGQAAALKKDTRYVEAYTNILKNTENATEELDAYYESEIDPSLKNKTCIVKIYNDLNNDKDVLSVVEQLDIKPIVCDKDKASINNITTNSDMFIWLNLVLAKAKNKQNKEVLNKIYEKLSVYDNDLNNNVEYNVFKSTYNCLTDTNNDLTFIKELLSGGYSKYSYDKQLIGVYKKLAASLLAYKKEEVSEEDEILLKEFATSQVGNRFMKDLEIIERFYKEEEKEKNE